MDLKKVFAIAVVALAFVGMTACSGSKSDGVDTAKAVDSAATTDTAMVASETAAIMETAAVAAEPAEAAEVITKGMKLKDVAAIPGVKFYADGSCSEAGGNLMGWVYVKYKGKKYETSVMYAPPWKAWMA